MQCVVCSFGLGICTLDEYCREQTFLAIYCWEWEWEMWKKKHEWTRVIGSTWQFYSNTKTRLILLQSQYINRMRCIHRAFQPSHRAFHTISDPIAKFRFLFCSFVNILLILWIHVKIFYSVCHNHFDSHRFF